MNKILTSLHGKLVGLNKNQQLLAKGFASGQPNLNTSLLAAPNPHSAVLFDDFLGDVIADQWNYAEGTDTATADGAIVALPGGVFRLTGGDSAGTIAADGAQLNSELNWRADQGNLVFQARVKVAAITTVSFFFGLTDTKSLEAPAALSGTTYTTDATDAVGVLFDTAATTDTLRLVGVANDVDAAHVDTGLAPEAGVYETWRIEVSKTGTAVFYRNGIQVGQLANAVTPTVPLTPVFVIRPQGAVAGRTMDIDYAYVSADRV